MSSYSEKLKDPRWQKRRLKIMDRDNFVCQICFDNESMLVVHHKIYLSNKEPWDYEDNLLVTLCEDCHQSEHNCKKESESLLIQSIYEAGFLSDDMREFARGFHNMKLQHISGVVSSTYQYALSNEDMQNCLVELYFKMLAKQRKEREKGIEKELEKKDTQLK